MGGAGGECPPLRSEVEGLGPTWQPMLNWRPSKSMFVDALQDIPCKIYCLLIDTPRNLFMQIDMTLNYMFYLGNQGT